MEYLDTEETIWISEDGNVFADEGSSSIDRTIHGNLHIKREIDELEVTGDVNGNVHVAGGKVEINGKVKGNVHAEDGTETIVRGDVLESIYGSSNVIVKGQISGKTYRNY